MDENIKYVKDGYREVFQKYREQKDDYQIHLPLFKQWLHHPDNIGKILELGCGSGFPIAHTILTTTLNYVGIDLSPEQIKMAQKDYPNFEDHFICKEMLEYCRFQEEKSFSGIISFFSIRHLPRIYHTELYFYIYRILRPQGLLLLDFPEYSEDGRDVWFDGSPMYWSSFSLEWNLLSLKETGFTLLAIYKDIQVFNGKKEYTSYGLFQKLL